MPALPRLLLPLLLVLAATVRAGAPPVELHPVAPLGAAFQNFDLALASDGRLLVANNSGVLLFDGARWTRLTHPTATASVWGVVPDHDGRIYSAFDGDLGWFAPRSDGGHDWHSLLSQLPEEARRFGTVYQVVRGREGIWYNPTTHLVLLGADGGLQVLRGNGLYTDVFAVGDSVWIQQQGAGLLRPEPDADAWKLVPIAGTESWAKRALNGLADLGAVGVLLLSARGELELWRDGRAQPFAADLWPRLAAVEPRRLRALRDGRIAISTTRGGLWVVDRAGALVEHYSDAEGVPALATYGMLEDPAGGLWLAQEHALVRIDRGSGLVRYGRAEGIPEAQALEPWNGRVYAGAVSGVYRLAATEASFERVAYPNLRFAYDLHARADRLWVAGYGVRRLALDAAGEAVDVQILSEAGTQQCRALRPSRFHPARVYVLCSDGVWRYDDADAAQPRGERILDAQGTMATIVEQDARTLWISASGPALLRLSDDGGTPWRMERFDARHGLPERGALSVAQGRDGIWFISRLGLLRFDAQAARFTVREDLLPPGSVLRLHEDSDGNLWAQHAGRTGVCWREAVGCRWDGDAFAADTPGAQVFDLLRTGGSVFVARSTGVTRLDLDRRQALPSVLAPQVVGLEDLRAGSPLPFAPPPSLPDGLRDLRLRFALPSLAAAGGNQYRSRLAGYDADWSPWSTRAERDYTNLPDGELRFEVEARDLWGRTSAAVPLALHGLPPWWRSQGARLGALLVLACALMLAAWAGARLRQRAWQARQRELEQTVAARTAELSLQNGQLAEQALLLQDQAARLQAADALKTRFFTNVGHEFRTPLTLVLGPLGDLLADPGLSLGGTEREQLELAERNARRVLDLIVELLDVNRLEQGQLPLRREHLDLIAFLQRQLPDWQALAARHGHALRLETPPLATLEFAFDPLLVERALVNLVGNAAKYTPRGGRIEICARADEQAVAITVGDDGPGISAQALAHVFDRFYQAEDAQRSHGSGIGLALVREIAQAHGGSVDATSALGVGSRFTLTLPRQAQADTPLPAAPTREADGPPLPRAIDLPLALVVDDHADLRLRLKRLLEPRFRVLEAGDGPSAHASARSELPDIVVSDVMMPGFDGVELARRLRADPDTAAVPLLLLTAKAGSEHAVAGLRAGADDYLAKPFDAAELLARIDALLALRRRLQRQLQVSAAADPPPSPTPLPDPDDERFRQRLEAAIAANLSDSAFGVEELAQRLHADRSTVFRRIKELYGRNAREHLRESRLLRAHELLASRAGNVTEVAYAVGFESLSSFARAFRQRFGCAPSGLATGQLRSA